MVCIPRETPLEKTDCFLCKRLTIGNIFWLVMGASFHFPSKHSLCEFICVSVLSVEVTVSLVFPSPLTITILLLHLLKSYLAPEGTGLIKTIHLGLSDSRDRQFSLRVQTLASLQLPSGISGVQLGLSSIS